MAVGNYYNGNPTISVKPATNSSALTVGTDPYNWDNNGNFPNIVNGGISQNQANVNAAVTAGTAAGGVGPGQYTFPNGQVGYLVNGGYSATPGGSAPLTANINANTTNTANVGGSPTSIANSGNTSSLSNAFQAAFPNASGITHTPTPQPQNTSQPWFTPSWGPAQGQAMAPALQGGASMSGPPIGGIMPGGGSGGLGMMPLLAGQPGAGGTPQAQPQQQTGQNAGGAAPMPPSNYAPPAPFANRAPGGGLAPLPHTPPTSAQGPQGFGNPRQLAGATASNNMNFTPPAFRGGGNKAPAGATPAQRAGIGRTGMIPPPPPAPMGMPRAGIMDPSAEQGAEPQNDEQKAQQIAKLLGLPPEAAKTLLANAKQSQQKKAEPPKQEDVDAALDSGNLALAKQLRDQIRNAALDKKLNEPHYAPSKEAEGKSKELHAYADKLDTKRDSIQEKMDGGSKMTEAQEDELLRRAQKFFPDLPMPKATANSGTLGSRMRAMGARGMDPVQAEVNRQTLMEWREAQDRRERERDDWMERNTPDNQQLLSRQYQTASKAAEAAHKEAADFDRNNNTSEYKLAGQQINRDTREEGFANKLENTREQGANQIANTQERNSGALARQQSANAGRLAGITEQQEQATARGAAQNKSREAIASGKNETSEDIAQRKIAGAESIENTKSETAKYGYDKRLEGQQAIVGEREKYHNAGIEIQKSKQQLAENQETRKALEAAFGGAGAIAGGIGKMFGGGGPKSAPDIAKQRELQGKLQDATQTARDSVQHYKALTDAQYKAAQLQLKAQLDAGTLKKQDYDQKMRLADYANKQSLAQQDQAVKQYEAALRGLQVDPSSPDAQDNAQEAEAKFQSQTQAFEQEQRESKRSMYQQELEQANPAMRGFIKQQMAQQEQIWDKQDRDTADRLKNLRARANTPMGAGKRILSAGGGVQAATAGGWNLRNGVMLLNSIDRFMNALDRGAMVFGKYYGGGAIMHGAEKAAGAAAAIP